MPIFPKRVLLDYAQPVAIGELRVGELYFIVNYVDAHLLVPSMEPVVFIGVGHPSVGKRMFAFQDASSYFGGIEPDHASVDTPVRVDAFKRNGLGSVFKFQGALDELLRCAMRRELTK